MVKYRLDAQHVELSDVDRELLGKKIDKLEKYVDLPYVMDVRFVHGTRHQSGDVFECLINLEHKKKVFHAERTGESVLIALDECVEALQQELTKEKEKRIRGRRWIKRILRIR